MLLPPWCHNIIYRELCNLYWELDETHALLIYLWYDVEKEKVSAGSRFDECLGGILHREAFGHCDLVKRAYSGIIFMTYFFYSGYVKVFAFLNGCGAKGKINAGITFMTHKSVLLSVSLICLFVFVGGFWRYCLHFMSIYFYLLAFP